jgi:hypothetical protein
VEVALCFGQTTERPKTVNLTAEVFFEEHELAEDQTSWRSQVVYKSTMLLE